MAFDSDTRNKLGRMVAQARQLLTDEFTQQLQEIYGIQPDGAIVNVDKLTHLDDEEVGTAKFLRERIGHLVSGMTSEKKPVVAAIDRAVREQAFTILNRFAALRMCEERSLVEECVRVGMQSKGFKVYETIAGSGLGNIYERYKTFLFCLFDEIAVDLGVLFDRFSPQGLLFPREQALLGILTIISNDGLSKLWTEDETIGWIYQYFNPPEERRAMREASHIPRNSRELAVRNQFFTPRYVVEFLTDSTLGRIWHEMRKGNTMLKEVCRYLVRRPNEIFLTLGEKAPAEPENKTDLSQEELLKKPFYIEHRPKKDPRELRVLDPACGSGHFLLYAFDLLERIYEEAWADPESPKSVVTGLTLREEYEILDKLRRAVPKLIIENNLHGIDIDPRAVQIATLALWLRAQKSWNSLSVKTTERPRIQRSNIVTAEPMPGEDDILHEFIKSLRPKLLGQLVKVVFDKMKLSGEAGSLLKIEDEIKEVITEAKKQWLEGPKMEQAVLFPEMAKPIPEQKQLRFDLTGVTDERFWEQAEDRILEELKNYAEKAENGHTLRRRLFAQDANQGFAFIDLCRKRYDVVLMNPPFGDYPQGIRELVASAYSPTKQDIGYCLLSRSIGLLEAAGRVGVIINRTGFFISELKGWRKRHLLEESYIACFADLGYGVLDGALVEVTATAIERSRPTGRLGLFINLLEDVDKSSAINEVYANSLSERRVHWSDQRVFSLLPDNQITHWISEITLKKLFSKPCLGINGEGAQHGMSTKKDFRFLRAAWEVPAGAIGQSGRWIHYAKGGEYQPYYDDLHLVVDWLREGRLIEAYVLRRYPYLNGNANWVMHYECSYFLPGLTYPERTTSDFSPRVLPKGCIFSVKGQSIFFKDLDRTLCFLGFSYSRPMKVLIEALVGGGDTSVSGSAARDYKMGLVNQLPMPWPSHEDLSHISSKVRRLIELARRPWQFDETSRIFFSPAILDRNTSFSERTKKIFMEKAKTTAMALELTLHVERMAYKAFELGEDEQKELHAFTGQHPSELPSQDLNRDKVNAIFHLRIEELIKRARAKLGGLRQVTKKSFFWDRRFELICLITDCSPRALMNHIQNIRDLPKEDALPVVIQTLEYAVGVCFGRWDIRIVIDPSLAPKLADPFDPLPVCPPGMLFGPDGLPAELGRIVSEEWLRARPDAITLPAEGTVKNPTMPDADYPLRISWDGILVDDPGSNGAQSHRDDIICRAREVLALLWKDKAHEVEQEACDFIGVTDVRDYFRRPSRFFQDHLKRYSKSRRKAPIYWPLSTKSGSYTLWIYYHSLTDQTLYACVMDYVNPKLDNLSKDIVRLLEEVAKQESTKNRQRLEQLMDFERELKDYRDELLRVAGLPYKPNLNDGVMITAAPLWKLFCHNQWRKELEACWKKLKEGEYDWAYLAYAIWPDRVKENCKTDLSIAIAHDLEDLYEGEDTNPKRYK